MAFIKVGDTVINTDHIVAVELDRISISGKYSVVILVTAQGVYLSASQESFGLMVTQQDRCETILKNPDNVTELLPSSPRSQARQRIRQRQHIRHRRSLAPEDTWDKLPSDPPDDLPPPTIRRRPWKPQPPPLSAAASV